MTRSRFLFQAITTQTHYSALKELFTLHNPTKIIISSAFITEAGLSLFSSELAALSAKVTIFAGIRNGITSLQGLQKALTLGCNTYAVDTGSRNILFHPKVYLSRNNDEAIILTGSANLTSGGMSSNIEASIVLHLDLSDKEYAAFVNEIEEQFNNLVKQHPEHVISIDSTNIIDNLSNSGRLIDESIPAPPQPASSSRNRDLDTVPRMRLLTGSIRPPRTGDLNTRGVQRGSRQSPSASQRTRDAARTLSSAPAAPLAERLILVWESDPLTERYLTIPSGSNTHATGSMLFTKGQLDNIDQRHYFRDSVFNDLNWQPDPAPSKRHLERAVADFRLIIRAVDYGVFALRLTHNTRTDTATYRQNNAVTQLHWGDARTLVARRDLLERTMRLYRDNVRPTSFVLELD